MNGSSEPTHFESVLSGGEAWLGRIRGVRANASRRRQAELDAAKDLDDGNPVELGRDCKALRAVLPKLTVLGGSCGTNHRHIKALCQAVQAWPCV